VSFQDEYIHDRNCAGQLELQKAEKYKQVQSHLFVSK
jgi:hypothetical protein